jgi:hypothetical protein
LILTGAPTEKNRSDACLLAASCSSGVTIIVISLEQLVVVSRQVLSGIVAEQAPRANIASD